ncbi:GSCFA domain protein [Fibrisoma limi BUZ 3]|uniref:GSCFA domain protein n=1 Tax=Fibrisoma limi BUZ 3 TaxID=1185876 RepID=I2GNM4_9BACT|nr:GSCFA domain-containing protein [Fibrisoma limi]CCH55502.1 GSCFA domain protein [Fibrisoma limi BUZ 3]
MLFHTELTPDSLPVPIRLTDRIVTIGSCFADVMGRQLTDHKIQVLTNPFGTVFNPISIAKLLTMALRGTKPDESLYVERDGIWFHYDFHSSLWARSRAELCERLTERLATTADALRRADWLLLTLGTAVVYRHIQTGQVVANCHKVPGSQFEKYLYQIDHLRDELLKLFKLLRRANPKLQVLLTVSPVRHTRDTLPLNQVSKSTLRVISHELTIWNDWVHYFPSYEIMVDDLRDYRFYEADLIHPNTLAQNYIFEKFAQCAFDDELRGFVTEWASIRKALAHRPLYGDTSAHRAFLNSLLKRLDTLRDLVNVDAERAVVLEQLVLSAPVQKDESRQTNSAQ